LTSADATRGLSQHEVRVHRRWLSFVAASDVYRTLADTLLLIHLLFILFMLAGGLLALRWPKLVWAHLPAALWGAVIEFAGWICPLTPLENLFRQAVGTAGYAHGFIEHYLLPTLYPHALTRESKSRGGRRCWC
jgi:hypothetical protein